MTHLVNTMRLEVTCGSEDDAFGLQHHLAPMVQQQVADAIEKAAAGMTDPEELIIIDRIEIDLGTLGAYINEQLLSSLIELEVMRQLQPSLQSKTPGKKDPKSPQHTKELFEQFMRTGSLPWWAQSLQPDISAVFMELVGNSKSWMVHFLYEQHAVKTFWQRIVFQLNLEAKKTLMASVEEIQQAFNELKAIISRVEHAAAGPVIPQIKKEEEKGTGTTTVAGSSSARLSEKDLLDTLLLEAPVIYAAVAANTLPQALKTIIKKHAEIPGMFPLLREVEPIKTTSVDATVAENAGSPASEKAKETGSKEEVAMPVSTANEQQEDGTEKYFIQHSGIILLSPFFKPFFNGLKFLEEGKWKTPAHCFKAVHLLKYLATGETRIAEYALTFEKIICGLPPDVPVPLDAGLEEHETAEADTLLKDVIDHWKALKNTSVNGLRETFLKRDGLITRKDNGWLLRPERKTADVLLDMIPWGFSVVRFSWNPVPLFTEW